MSPLTPTKNATREWCQKRAVGAGTKEKAPLICWRSPEEGGKDGVCAIRIIPWACLVPNTKSSANVRAFLTMEGCVLATNEVVLIGSDTLGSGDEKLGVILMSSFLRLLSQRGELPKAVVMLNTGVRLAARDTETVEFVKALEDKGVKVILCRTCVEYFGLEDGLDAGTIDGMVAIQDLLFSHKVVTV